MCAFNPAGGIVLVPALLIGAGLGVRTYTVKKTGGIRKGSGAQKSHLRNHNPIIDKNFEISHEGSLLSDTTFL
jgi:hypothetical protein